MYLSTQKFIDRANTVHNGHYDYSAAEYKKSNQKIIIICLTHGQFLQTPNNHLRGQGCPHCAITRIAKLHSQTSEKFLRDAVIAHGNRYDYSNAIFEKNNQKVIIICREHGEFLQTPHIHTYEKAGCYKCGREKVANKQRNTRADFVEKARKIHNDTYDYSSVIYKGAHTPISIICKNHGKFDQRPGDHIRLKQGCPKCSSCISRIEISWLDSLNVPSDYRQKNLYINNKRIRVDAHDPITNTIYEFWGDYWHGNPLRFSADDINANNKKTFGKLYNETQTKRKLILDAGYNLIEIWESEFRSMAN